MRAARITCLLAAFGAVSSPAFAQWLQLPLPGTPRTKEGKPNLSAPAPRTVDGKPDLSGIWEYHLWSDPSRAAAAATAITPPPAPVTLGVPAAPPGATGLKNLLQNGDQILFQPGPRPSTGSAWKTTASACLPSTACPTAPRAR